MIFNFKLIINRLYKDNYKDKISRFHWDISVCEQIFSFMPTVSFRERITFFYGIINQRFNESLITHKTDAHLLPLTGVDLQKYLLTFTVFLQYTVIFQHLQYLCCLK